MKKLLEGAKELCINLDPRQLERFDVYYRELVHWNRKVNLTSITEIEDVYTRHFLDSLTVFLAFESEAVCPRVIDIGAGAGFPGLPLKIGLPSINLVLLEATAKKADFLRYIVDKLGLQGVEVAAGRAEDMAHEPDSRERFDYCVSRAVAGMAALAELMLPFCAVGGRIIAQKKGDIAAELAGAAKAISLMGGGAPRLIRVELPALSDDRYLVIIDKLEKTPGKYPRRSGMPVKRPIM